MAAELVDHSASIMCIIERTSSDISDKPAFTPPGHIKRQQCKSKEDLFCKIFDIFIVSHSVRYKTFQRIASCTLDFQAGNFTGIRRMKSYEDISFKSLLLQGKDLKSTRRRLQKKLERFQSKEILAREQNVLSVSFLFPRTLILSIFKYFFHFERC